MHNESITHRDLKLENILLDKDFNLKVIDFGLTAPVEGRDGSGTLKTNIGTAYYKPPQMYNNTYYQGPEADMYAAFINLFAFKCANFPFSSA
jgi:serine/threonine protein kinase